MRKNWTLNINNFKPSHQTIREIAKLKHLTNKHSPTAYLYIEMRDTGDVFFFKFSTRIKVNREHRKMILFSGNHLLEKEILREGDWFQNKALILSRKDILLMKKISSLEYDNKCLSDPEEL